MLGQLVESSPRRVRRRSSTVVSIVAHALVVSAAVAAARPVPEDPPVTPVVTWYPAPPPAPPDCTNCSSRSSPTSQTGSDVPTLRRPGDILDDLTITVPERVGAEIEGVPVSIDEWPLRISGRGHGDTTAVLGREAVDRQVVPLPSNPPPNYPATLRAARIEGSVSVRFVVDTTGRVLVNSVIVDAADHPLFAEAVIDALRRARFTPAELRGRRVAQLVAQPFVFVIRE